jgi:hypothetical protein
MNNYVIVKSRSVDDLSNKVNGLIDKGYMPVGAMVIAQEYPVDIMSGPIVRVGIEHGMMFFQPMLLKE